MRRFLIAFVALAIGALVFGAYRELLARPFAADDYQWLLNVRGLGLGEILRRAFAAGEQAHFYRPLVWLLFWAQVRAFDLDPRGFHVVSLALHLVNAGLVAGLAYRLQIANCTLPTGLPRQRFTIDNLHIALSCLAALFVALHPAPFEAVVWISGQSELLSAALLLLALHFWLPRPANQESASLVDREKIPISLPPRFVRSVLALGLALLAKESAVIGLPLLALLDLGTRRMSQAADQRPLARWPPLTRYLLPALLTLGYLALQVAVERQNYLLRQGGYGLGPQIVLNPLRSLALIVAPLAGSEHADAGWLVPAGALLALGLLALLVWGGAGARRLVLALGLTLLPTAPFVSPPDSRYLYLPVLAAAVMLALGLAQLPLLFSRSSVRAGYHEPQALSFWGRLGGLARWWLLIAAVLGAGCWAWGAAGELRARENRFAAGTGPGGSLWRLASSLCAEQRPDRLIVVEPPVAGPHVLAIAELACGAGVRTMVVGREQVAGALKGHSVVISFPNGSAAVERTT